MPHDDIDGLRLDRAVDSITVGYRHRRELGDLGALCDSIRRIGLLGPLTVTPDGLLLCGWRRLEAVKLLGWKSVPVFVRRASSGLHDLIAEHDENIVREPLPLETAEELYREYKVAETEQAALRQQATRFRAAKNSKNEGWKDGNANGGGKRDNSGPAESAAPRQDEPVPGRHGDARAKAAQIVTGTKSYTRLEHTGRIKDTRDDPSMPDHIRAMAETAWNDITNNNASPEKQWKQIRAAITEHRATEAGPSANGSEDELAELAAMAQTALARPRALRPREPLSYDASTPPELGTTQPLAALVANLDEWVSRTDADALALTADSSDLTRLHRLTERLDHLCTRIHSARHKRHPALRRQKPTGTQGHTVNEEQPPLW
ncbi:chromosome partitioning protein, ParB family [Promicromonospora umidemergens]|uniref:ParB-like N-terminal domain-containing protein n=1 Tax=Promicromonospora umidemergens TaxID=629679 RepID=A0ABP8XTJ8_9MICO|nr:ParB N-terminal domain-containing protein [Promicromonospora umidemergens]MCP2285379.1 chromosome partitioning protein, ParB family [Promicromonospora umidemergens]